MKPVKLCGTLLMCGVLVLASPVQSADLPAFDRLDDAARAAVRETCASWVIEEGGKRIASWSDSILPLCEVARAADIETARASAEAEARAMSAASSSYPPKAVSEEPEDVLQRMKSLKSMLDSGLITQVDYDAAKAALLQKMVQ
tara:strand:+ start:3627 stop:4058 length:432 start_codon:yes stop_codon:yes gene_type:complete